MSPASPFVPSLILRQRDTAATLKHIVAVFAFVTSCVTIAMPSDALIEISTSQPLYSPAHYKPTSESYRIAQTRLHWPGVMAASPSSPLQFKITCVDGMRAMETSAARRDECLQGVGVVVCVFNVADRASWDVIPSLVEEYASGERICCIGTKYVTGAAKVPCHGSHFSMPASHRHADPPTFHVSQTAPTATSMPSHSRRWMTLRGATSVTPR